MNRVRNAIGLVRWLQRELKARRSKDSLTECQPKVNLAQIEDEYARLRARLGRLGWISHGYVQDRGPGAGGPCYRWTRKVKAKTVSVALSQRQYKALKEAIDNWQDAQDILQRMQAVSRVVIFQNLPSPLRRKRLERRF